MKIFKKSVYIFWILTIVGLLIFAICYPDFFEVDNLKALFYSYQGQVLFLYITVSILRGFFLIPSTPFVLLGVILFTNSPWMVFAISMIAIIVSTTALYYFSDILGFSEKLKKKFPKKMELWTTRLGSPYSTLFVLVWSFFPLVPTDLICYVAGIIKMPFKYLLIGVVVGESILVYCYVFLGAEFLNFIG